MSINLPTTYITTSCCHDGCHISFAITIEFYKQRLKDKEDFYCPRGHGQHYINETEEQKLKNEVTRLEKKVEFVRSCKRKIEYSRRHWKGEVTKLKRKESP